MKKILIITLTLLLPLVLLARGNKALTKWQQNLQKHNEQIVQRLQMLSNTYNHTEKAEIKQQIEKEIEHEIDMWYMNNMQTVNELEQEQFAKEEKEIDDIYSEEHLKKVKVKLAEEIKAGTIPEIMLKTLPEQTAERLRIAKSKEKDRDKIIAKIEEKVKQAKAGKDKQSKKGFFKNILKK